MTDFGASAPSPLEHERDQHLARMNDFKKIFDPYNTLNPGVKIDVSLDDIKPLLRQEYSITQADHLPHN